MQQDVSPHYAAFVKLYLKTGRKDELGNVPSQIFLTHFEEDLALFSLQLTDSFQLSII